jgi:hypothetical protein
MNNFLCPTCRNVICSDLDYYYEHGSLDVDLKCNECVWTGPRSDAVYDHPVYKENLNEPLS